MSQESEAQVATQLAEDNHPQTESSTSVNQPPSNPPEGISSLGNPPPGEDSVPDEPVLPESMRRRTRRKPVMSVDTPRPQREGAVFTVEEARRYEAVALEFTTQCAYFLNMMNVANPEVELPVPGDLEDPAMRVTYVGELFEYATRFDNEAKQ